MTSYFIIEVNIISYFISKKSKYLYFFLKNINYFIFQIPQKGPHLDFNMAGINIIELTKSNKIVS